MQFKMIPTNDISGFGVDVLKIVNIRTDESVGYVGETGGRKAIHLIKPISIVELVHLADQFQKCSVAAAPVRVAC